NSFVAGVEFGDRVRAKAVTAGGESGDPKSKHFGDQAERYATGDLRDVWFYRADVEQHAERQYHPGRGGLGKRNLECVISTGCTDIRGEPSNISHEPGRRAHRPRVCSPGRSGGARSSRDVPRLAARVARGA